MSDLFDLDESTRISELVTKIKKAQNSYYNGEAEITDSEFDKMWDELKSLDPQNALLKKVGEDSGNFLKKKHIMPMGSQEKASCPEEFLSWANTHVYPEYFVEYKLDGASLELQYEKGILKSCVTRGDGEIGDDITFNAKKMGGVISKLFDENGNSVDFTGGIRGEVIMTHKVHQTLYSDKANCRNAANGLMKKKDGKGCENLTLIVYDSLCTEGISPFYDEEEKIVWLKKMGFNVVPLKICSTPQEVIEYRVQVMEKRGLLQYDIDGLVIKERKIDLDDAFRARPDRQIAFKFSLEEAVTILKEVEWSESGSTYTPVGIFDEVQLNGTTVQRASFANPDTMRALKVKIGSRIVVVKRGEIIPKIIKVLPEENGDKTFEIKIPQNCSCCNTRLIDEGTRLYCPNKNCPKRVLHQLLKWTKTVDIRDFGETLITSLFNDGILRKISDIYSLTQEKLIPYFLNEESISKEKDSLGAKKVYESIQNHKKMTLSVFIAGFDIEGIGETTVEKLENAGINTVKKLFKATKEELSNVSGFADIMAENLIEGLNENQEEIEYLLKNKIIQIKENLEGRFTGKSFCFTGELKTMKRADAENLVKQNGGTAKSSVTKDLSYLVTNDTSSGSSKNQKAQKLNIPIISENEFLEMLK